MEGQSRCQIIKTGPVKHICRKKEEENSFQHSNRVRTHIVYYNVIIMYLSYCSFQCCEHNKQKSIYLYCIGRSLSADLNSSANKTKQYPSLDMTGSE